MGQKVTRKEFEWVGTDEPHYTRRKQILAKYPQIKKLYGPDIRLLYWVLTLVSLQLLLATIAVDMPGWMYWFAAWSIGGTITHALSLANHELSHNLAFHTTIYNELLAFISNFAQAIPSAITFKKYHLEHHYSQGEDGVDSDIPIDWEGDIFNTAWKKAIWAFLQPLFYALRPVIAYPKPMLTMEYVNLVAVLAFDFYFAYKFGIWATLFNVFSTLLGMGLHPVAGHFIAEHYLFYKTQETYSYYGVLNRLCFNVGYHNEHHDFPKISGFNLPRVKEIAPEFYNDLYIHTSWVKVIYNYIFSVDIGPYSRVKRPRKKLK